MGGPGSGRRDHESRNGGRKRNDSGFQFRAWCRDLIAEPKVRAAVAKRARTDPDFALRVAEHGFGRPPQSLDVKVGTGKGTIRHTVTVAGGGALPPGAAGVPAAAHVLDGAD
jgi:hypothetical protein